MERPTRRRLLTGVSAGSVLLSTKRWRADGGHSTDSDDGSSASASAESTLEVRISETNAPVAAGEYLEVTPVVENTGSTAVRTTVELIVGHDRERVSTVETTIDAGETREPMRMGFNTYPVPESDEFPVRVDADGATDERTVRVEGASTLANARPGADLSVEPGTSVLFEAGAVDPGDGQRTIWWLDGEQIGDTAVDTWQPAYYDERGAHFFRYAFDSPGTHEVTAAVLPDAEAGTYGARWTIDVTADGTRAPAIETSRPTDQVIEVARDDPADVEFELEATVPDGALDRVIWWLTQSDSILGVSDLEDRRDTARLSTVGCHTCTLVPWVVCRDGTVTEPDPSWQFERVDRRGTVEVTIHDTNDPVAAGDVLEVAAAVVNTGSTAETRELELVVGHDPTVVDARTVVVDPNETARVRLGFETYPTEKDERFPARVVTEDDADEVSVRVFA
ncbi:hypothetical protein EA462_00185 [Natrarchaeobius halalkaliphilus]|uniref:CARDB domain-containing protein n=1 Tax=Natrarchaeobius halalkaliphilus TaxID=1679091 RepID=A0A3N6N4Z1_9EURY|nr:hypothetical protein [Natrarchaeobius halalkaliphilus]RQG93272.1 hypothetical protein EA462_00185 [Natrarchaeobius halalkaliphilus]